MSRVGKKPIEIPKTVEVKIEGNKVLVKGPKGELSQEIYPEVQVELKENKIIVSPKIKVKKTNAMWGTTRALVANCIKGVIDGFEKKLEIRGLGYRGSLEGESLVLQVGFTHPFKIEAPEGIKFSVEKNIITVSGINKELVGQTASKIKKIRKPEPYKGKGIRYLGEVVRKKAGKKAVSAE